MNKNTVIGLLLIMGLLVGYSVWRSPSKEELKEKQRIQDSLALLQKNMPSDTTLSQPEIEKQPQDIQETTTFKDSLQGTPNFETQKSIYGAFVSAAQTPENTNPIIIENDLYKLSIGRKGGRIESVELKNVYTDDGKPVILYDENSKNNQFGFSFFSNYLELNTND
ncbi:MAG: hypothetical protein PHC83_06415, partial [Bacteroidales bacterium]|nr:hypothetical protein [Bacteroidales bacterium]